MSTSDLMNYFEDLDENDPLENGKRGTMIRNLSRDQKKQKSKNAVPAKAAQRDAGQDFEFSYNASRHEREWIIDSLGDFYQMHWFDDVLQLIKGGKEASVYLCLGNETTRVNHLAAKVYRPRRLRNLRKDHLYREGRRTWTRMAMRSRMTGCSMPCASAPRMANSFCILPGSSMRSRRCNAQAGRRRCARHF